MADIEVTQDGAVQTITLNRPERMNAFTRNLHAELLAALEDARGPTVRAVVITGAGSAFCAGQDLAEFAEAGDVGTLLRETYHPTVEALQALEKPVFAAVNGACAGAGLSLAAACDIRIASEAAVFVPAFVGIGLVPDAGGSHFLRRILGPARAFEWMTSNRRLTATEAYQWGLLSEVVDAEALAARAAELAQVYASMATAAIGMTKRLFHASAATLAEQLELEAQLQAVAAGSLDFQEGVAAFLGKRPPSFTGK